MTPPALPSSAIKRSAPKWIVVNRVVFALLTVAIAGGVFRYQSGLLSESRRWVNHTHAVEEQIFSVFLKLKRMESAQRGYVLTGNPEYLRPYGRLLGLDSSWGAVGRTVRTDSFLFHGLDTLRGLIADNPNQIMNTDSLRHLMERRLTYSRFIIAVRREKGLDETQRLSKTGIGARLTDSIETLVGRMVEEEQRLAETRTRVEARELRTQKWVVYGGMALFFSGLLFMIFLESLHWKRRQALQRKLDESNALLDAVINGSDYGIFGADPDGIIRIFSKGAERMLGYTASEGIGKHVTEFTRKTFLPEESASRARRLAEQYGRPPEGLEVFRLPLKDDGPLGQEWTNIRKDGTRITVAMSVWVLETPAGEPQGSVAIVRDISRIKELEEAKHDFIATVSHELRTPLTSIQGAIGLVAGGAVGPLSEKASELLAIAYRNTEQLVRLINDILDIEKIEAGKISVQIQPLDAADSLREALNANRPYGDKFGVRMILKQIPAGVLVSADPDRLAQILTNLLSNACKYSSAGGEVWVEAEARPETVRFSVRDFGPGIPESFQSLVFEKFMQHKGGTARGVESTGLGLSITKKLVETMRGTIGFETEAGKGTTFFFELPRAV